ncbi:MAG: FGGY-family carbohydrate kinase [Thermoguttaceae bacterium]
MSEPVTKNAIFIGVHLQNDKVVAIAVSEYGQEMVKTEAQFAHPPVVTKGLIEQQPEIWWDAVRNSLGQLTSQLRKMGVGPTQVRGISVCGPPGTLVILDRAGNPIAPAIMYNDARATEQLTKLNMLGVDHCRRMGFQFRADDTIAKIAWIKDNLPELYEVAVFSHQTDYIVGRLKGGIDVTEYSLAVNTGCDLIDESWPDWLDYDMHLGVRDRLPKLVHLGAAIGKVSSAASAATGLPQGVPVVMGSSSATAGFLASGTRKMGDFYTIVGDSLSISGITKRILKYPHHLIKMFKLPNQSWFFSTECNTGAEWLSHWFKDTNVSSLEKEANKLLPTDYIAYPNCRKGELFPFCSTSAEGFISPATDNREVQFASCLQGTALFERMCYEKIEELSESSSTQGEIYTGGPWAKNDSWMQCRADVSGRINHRTVSENGPAFGAALIAAIGSHFKKFEDAAHSMINIDRTFFPNPEKMPLYQEHYTRFSTMMEEQGYAV